MADNGARRMNILHAVRALDIGGVTTYVFRLAKGLVARGHRVTILAQEGTWREPPPVGVEWIPCRWPGGDDLVSWVAASKFDLVHTHNYGPTSRFGSLLSRRLDLPYVMTAHGPRHVLQRLVFRAWSRRVLVVSEADRCNVTSFGGISPYRVETGFIGMDTEQFRPGLETGPLWTEFGIAPGTPVVTHISRFDTSKIAVTQAVLKVIPALCEQIPGITTLLVGSGSHAAEVSGTAEQINARMGRRAVISAAARSDIPAILNMSNALIATATTALEGMSCGVPTIGAGRTGYFGLVSPENFEAGHTICFGDHGRSPSAISAEWLLADLMAIFRDERKARGDALSNRRIIERRYSAECMTEQIERTYRRIISECSANAETQLV